MAQYGVREQARSTIGKRETLFPSWGFAQQVTCWLLNIADSHTPIADV
jgi:hypothetical protein